ncbi:collagen-like protein [Salmonella enterica subsp. enterica serovar Newport]|nr:collagen-like protein [Salmonella enterica subsp. enterica serovar Newport]
MKGLLFVIISLLLIPFSGVSYAAVISSCSTSGVSISGHFDNVIFGYDGKVHVSSNGCDYVSAGAIQPTSTIMDEQGGTGYDGQLQSTGKTAEEFEKFNSAYMSAQEDFNNKNNSPEQQKERICQVYGCDASGNPLPEDEKINPDYRTKTVLDVSFPHYDKSKSYAVNAANFNEAISHFKDYKFSSLSKAYQFRDDMKNYYNDFSQTELSLYPNPNSCGYWLTPKDPAELAKFRLCIQQAKAREEMHKQINTSLLPSVVQQYIDAHELNTPASFNEVFQTMVDPLAVLSGNSQGVDGVNGQNGADGKDGKDGKDGINGRDGKDGVNGLNGRDGVDGKDGQSGEKGDKGDPGETGEGVDNEELARFHHDSVVASGNIIDLLGRIHDAVIGSGSSSPPSGSSPVSPSPSIDQGGSSATPGQSTGRPSGSSDGDGSGLLNEVQGFHHDANENARKLIEALSGQNKTGDDADDSDGIDDSDEVSSLNDSLDEFALLSDKALLDYENLINNVNVPDMDISKGFTDMFKGAGGACKPFSFEIKLPLSNSRVLTQRVSLDNFCFFWDTYARALLNFSFDISAFIACYLILMRGIRKYE